MARTKLEDAVLSLLGEANQGEKEVTETGTPDWAGLPARKDAKAEPRVTVPLISFGPRRSATELPWTTLGSRAE